jgi:chorismate lyase
LPRILRPIRELLWCDEKRLLKTSPISAPLRSWLLDKSSLTAKLIALSRGRFRVQVLRQIKTRVGRGEALALGINRSQLTLVREVVLMGNNQAWVFARSVLPLNSLTGRLRHLRKQGARPLGAFLFSQPHLKRSPIALGHISRHHRYVPVELLGDQQSVWGRRSIFDIEGKKLLVSEVFLPGFPGAMSNPNHEGTLL